MVTAEPEPSSSPSTFPGRGWPRCPLPSTSPTYCLGLSKRYRRFSDECPQVARCLDISILEGLGCCHARACPFPSPSTPAPGKNTRASSSCHVDTRLPQRSSLIIFLVRKGGKVTAHAKPISCIFGPAARPAAAAACDHPAGHDIFLRHVCKAGPAHTHAVRSIIILRTMN